MNLKKLFPLFLIIILAIITIVIRKCNTSSTAGRKTNQSSSSQRNENEKRGLDRNPTQVNYSKHAVCRMQCRHITQKEIQDILSNGTINYKKSELQGNDCNKKYAVEGTSKDGQHLRVIFAPCANEITVVTCIDTKQEWDCPDCK